MGKEGRLLRLGGSIISSYPYALYAQI